MGGNRKREKLELNGEKAKNFEAEEKEKPVAKRHNMVSGTLAPL